MKNIDSQNGIKSKGNISIRKLIFSLLSVLCMAVIFIYSSRNADLSTEDSNAIGLAIGDITIEDFDQWTSEARLEYAASIDHPVRKTAHFLEYMTLGILLVGASYDSKRKNRFNILVPYVIGSLYAVTDELHQKLISGRSGQLTDVLLDSSGVIAGVVLTIIIIFLNRRFTTKN